jgi:hypothetical protein
MDEARTVQARIIAYSTNTNSFGLRGVVLDIGGQVWEAGANSIFVGNHPIGQTLICPLDDDETPNFAKLGLEIPRKLSSGGSNGGSQQ